MVSSPGSFLAEPYVRLAPQTAPVIQTVTPDDVPVDKKPGVDGRHLVAIPRYAVCDTRDRTAGGACVVKGDRAPSKHRAACLAVTRVLSEGQLLCDGELPIYDPLAPAPRLAEPHAPT